METAPPPAPLLSRRDRAAAVLIAAVLLPNLAVLVWPYEHFPFSSAPMFAHYVTHESPRYRFRFVAEPADGGAEWELHARDVGLRNVELHRHFFGFVYGSHDPRSPYGHHPPHDREQFQARVESFLQRFASVAERNAPGARTAFVGIRLELARLDEQNRDGEVRVVGRYDRATERFLHTWGVEP